MGSPPELPASILVGLRNRPQRGRLTQVHLGWEAPKVRHVQPTHDALGFLKFQRELPGLENFHLKIFPKHHIWEATYLCHIPNWFCFFLCFQLFVFKSRSFWKKSGAEVQTFPAFRVFFLTAAFCFFFFGLKHHFAGSFHFTPKNALSAPQPSWLPESWCPSLNHWRLVVRLVDGKLRRVRQLRKGSTKFNSPRNLPHFFSA